MCIWTSSQIQPFIILKTDPEIEIRDVQACIIVKNIKHVCSSKGGLDVLHTKIKKYICKYCNFRVFQKINHLYINIVGMQKLFENIVQIHKFKKKN